MNRYDRAAALFPRNVARILAVSEYTAPVPEGRQPSAEYLKAQRAADERAFWDSAVSRPIGQGGLMGSRYQGGYSVPMRVR
jgi:hypothetical protein